MGHGWGRCFGCWSGVIERWGRCSGRNDWGRRVYGGTRGVRFWIGGGGFGTIGVDLLWNMIGYGGRYPRGVVRGYGRGRG